MGRWLMFPWFLDLNGSDDVAFAVHDGASRRDLDPVKPGRLEQKKEITQTVPLNDDVAEPKEEGDPFIRLIVSGAGIVGDPQQIAPEKRFTDRADPEHDARLQGRLRMNLIEGEFFLRAVSSRHKLQSLSGCPTPWAKRPSREA